MDKRTGLFPPIDPALVSLIKEKNRFAVMSHRIPDGDAAFSSLAMKRILEKMGKKVFLYSEGPFDRRGQEKIKDLFSAEPTEEEVNSTEVVIVLDCSTEDRPGTVYVPFKGKCPVVVLDHHASGLPFYEEKNSYIVPKSPSTTLLVDELRRYLDVELDRYMAECLMKGFLTDTGFFHFLNEEQAPDSLEKVRSFCLEGISPYELIDELLDGKDFNDIMTITKMLSETRRYYDGSLAVVDEPLSIDTKENPGDMIYHTLLETQGVKAVCLIKEKEDAVVFGFRAKNRAGIDVGELAFSLGGGGHRLASGCTVKDVKFEDAEKFIVEKFRPLFEA